MHSTVPRVEWDRTLMRRDQAAKGWNDTDLAREAGVHQASIGRWFAGKTSSPKLAAKIAVALGHDDAQCYILLPPVAPPVAPPAAAGDSEAEDDRQALLFSRAVGR